MLRIQSLTSAVPEGIPPLRHGLRALDQAARVGAAGQGELRGHDVCITDIGQRGGCALGREVMY